MFLAFLSYMLFHISYIQNLVPQDPLSVSSLKRAEREYWKRFESPRRNGKVDLVRLERAKDQFRGLARGDASEFFEKNVPLNKSNMPTIYLLTWVALATGDIMTFNFQNHKARLSLASDYFTEDGWKNFSDTLKRSHIIEMVEINQQIITAVPKGAPIFQSYGIEEGVYQWVVEIPMVLTYQSGAKTSNTGLLVKAVIVRSDDPKHPYGIAIDKWSSMTN